MPINEKMMLKCSLCFILINAQVLFYSYCITIMVMQLLNNLLKNMELSGTLEEYF